MRGVRSLTELLLPQGWAFFTKSSQEPTVLPFDDQGKTLSELPTSRAFNWFGASRRGRAQGVEVGLLQQSLQEKNWKDCSGMTVADCVSVLRKDQKQPLQNPIPKSTLCGEVYLVRVEIPAFAYRSLVKDGHRILDGIGLDIDCN